MPKPTLHNNDFITINNAGMVLLHPFLDHYFTWLGLMENGAFINTNAQHRAVQLLQYLVNGAEATPEHDLALNKALCNLSLIDPMPTGVSVTEQEKQLSQELLTAVTQHWDRLANNSISVFQASFLQREGMIRFDQDSVRLRVEQRGYDVLLQTIPWSLGTIKTAWMHKPLHVEWT
jgi:hypothetical protein